MARLLFGGRVGRAPSGQRRSDQPGTAGQQQQAADAEHRPDGRAGGSELQWYHGRRLLDRARGRTAPDGPGGVAPVPLGGVPPPLGGTVDGGVLVVRSCAPQANQWLIAAGFPLATSGPGVTGPR